MSETEIGSANDRIFGVRVALEKFWDLPPRLVLPLAVRGNIRQFFMLPDLVRCTKKKGAWGSRFGSGGETVGSYSYSSVF